MYLTFLLGSIALIFSVLSMASFSAHGAVYFIILAFLSTGLLYYIIGSTYVAIILFIVYVGAVAMLFIFCVILLNLQYNKSEIGLRYYLVFPLLAAAAFGAWYIFCTFFQVTTLDIFHEWPSFSYSLYSKDHMFLSTFYTLNSFYVILIGLLLFFVTVAVTALLA
jgi:NADH:ubiquinone oxidoreductase subunit 6 (subunit J)